MRRIREHKVRGSGIFKRELPELETIKNRIELDEETLGQILKKMGFEGDFWTQIASSINQIRRIFRPALFCPKTGRATSALVIQIREKGAAIDQQIEENANKIGELFRAIKEAKIERLIESGEKAKTVAKEMGISENAIQNIFRKCITKKGVKISREEIEKAIENAELFGEKLAKGNLYGHPIAKIIRKTTGKSYCDIYFSQNEIREEVHKLRRSKITKLKEEGHTETQIAQKLGIGITRIISEKSVNRPKPIERKVIQLFRYANQDPPEIARKLRIGENRVYEILEKFKLIAQEQD